MPFRNKQLHKPYCVGNDDDDDEFYSSFLYVEFTHMGLVLFIYSWKKYYERLRVLTTTRIGNSWQISADGRIKRKHMTCYTFVEYMSNYYLQSCYEIKMAAPFTAVCSRVTLHLITIVILLFASDNKYYVESKFNVGRPLHTVERAAL